jgi:hypothetical protein
MDRDNEHENATCGRLIFMSYEMSNCMCVQVPDMEKARTFYETLFHGRVVHEDEKGIKLEADTFRIFLDKGDTMGSILEGFIPYMEQAREELIDAGCTPVLWESKGKRCYLRDPFGVIFNLFEISDHP